MGVALTLSSEWKKGHFVLDPQMYQYPTFFTYILALCFFFSKKIIFAEQYGRVVSSLASVLTILSAYLIGCRAKNVRAGIISAVFVTFGFLFVHQGRYVAPDSLQMLLFSFGLFFILKDIKTGKRQFVLSGIFIGLGAGTKYTALIFFIPIMLSIFLGAILMRERFLDQIKSWFGWTFSMLAAFLFTTPVMIPKFKLFLERMQFERFIQKSGLISTAPPRFWDYLFLTKPIDHEHFFAQSIVGGMGWEFTVLSLFALIWVCIAAWKSKKFDVLGIGMSIILTYVYFTVESKIHVIRFMIILVLMMCILLSLLIDDIADMIAKFTRNRIRPLIVSIFLTMIVFIPNLGMCLDYLKALTKPDTRVIAADWIFKNISPEEKTLVMLWDPALPGKYNTVQWAFPVYPFELGNPNSVTPTIDRLRQEKISCVIWNGTFKNNLEGPYENELIEAHQKQWKVFYADLNRLKNSDRYFETIGEISSTIQIFCPDKNGW